MNPGLYLIGEVVKRSGVRTAKVNACIQSGIVSFVRDPENDYRLFDDQAIRILKVYHALDLLSIKLTHAQCCAAIKTVPLTQLEAKVSEGQNSLLHFMADHLDGL